MRDAQEDLRICEAATPGEWWACLGSGHNVCTAIHSDDQPGKLICDFVPDYFLNKGFAIEDHRPNMNFVTTARIAFPYWINRAVAAEKRIAELEGQIILNERQRLKEAADREEDIYHTVERMRKAEARVAELEVALEPFAQLWDPGPHMPDRMNWDIKVNFGAIRRARRVLGREVKP